MDKEEIIKHIDRMIKNCKESDRAIGNQTEAKEFIKTFTRKNEFYNSLEGLKPVNADNLNFMVKSVLRSFKEFVENDLLRNVSLEREIQIETVSDYLAQAESLLNDKKVHPAAPAVLIGASLEEFLRNWLEEEGTELSNIKNSLDSYTKELRTLNKITKQDVKDITSWGGTRNDAAHGHWDNVKDKNRIKLMLEGVNLFMRKYSE